MEATIGCETARTSLSLVTRGKDYLLLSVIVSDVVWTIFPRCALTNQSICLQEILARTLNYLEVIPSPFAKEEEKDRASLRVVTRAQAQKDPKKVEPKALEATQKKSCKRNTRRGIPKKDGKKSKSGSEPNTQGENREELTKKERSQEPTKPAEALTSSSSSLEGGSVLIDKKYEPLEAAI